MGAFELVRATQATARPSFLCCRQRRHGANPQRREAAARDASVSLTPRRAAQTTETPTGEKIPWRQVVRETALNTRAKSWSYTKGFSQMGALYSGSECVVEKARAAHS